MKTQFKKTYKAIIFKIKFILWAHIVRLSIKKPNIFNIASYHAKYARYSVKKIDKNTVYFYMIDHGKEDTITANIDEIKNDHISFSYSVNTKKHQRIYYLDNFIILLLLYPFIFSGLIFPFLKLRLVLKHYFLQRKKIIVLEKHNLINFLINNTRLNQQEYFHVSNVMSDLYGQSVFCRKDILDIIPKISLQLDSLCESMDLVKIDHDQYRMTGKAWETYSNWKRDESRHNDVVKTQRKLTVITCILVFTGLLQAYASDSNNKLNNLVNDIINYASKKNTQTPIKVAYPFNNKTVIDKNLKVNFLPHENSPYCN